MRSCTSTELETQDKKKWGSCWNTEVSSNKQLKFFTAAEVSDANQDIDQQTLQLLDVFPSGVALR